jgi:hypothetical protein
MNEEQAFVAARHAFTRSVAWPFGGTTAIHIPPLQETLV